MKKWLLALAACLSMSATFARTDCPVAPIDNIQIEDNKVMYTQSGVWRTLGYLEETGTKERYSALLAAHLAGRNVMVAYASDTYNCGKTNYADSAFIVRTYK